VTHNTEYDYRLPVVSSQLVLRLKPRDLPRRQTLLDHTIRLSVKGTEILEQLDYFGNVLHEVRLHTRHDALSINATFDVEVTPRDEILLDLSPAWETAAKTLRDPQTQEQWHAAQFCFPSPHVNVAAALELAKQLAVPGTPTLRLALQLTEFIYREFTYKGGVTDVHTDVKDVIRRRVGVCQDFAHTLIALMRSLGLAIRYVSGYILSQLDGRPALVGAEATHAWVSVYCPEFGWVDFDPTNNQITSGQHIVLGWGRDYADVAPTRGYILGGGQQKLEVDVRVRKAS